MLHVHNSPFVVDHLEFQLATFVLVTTLSIGRQSTCYFMKFYKIDETKHEWILSMNETISDFLSLMIKNLIVP